MSDLLASFGAHQSPDSKKRMERSKNIAQALRQKPAFSYAESDGSGSPAPSPAKSSYSEPQTPAPEQQDVSDDEDEEDEDEDTIIVTPRPSTGRPQRSTTSYQSYATPKRPIKKKKGPKKKGPLLKSDTRPDKAKKASSKPDTARTLVRRDIEDHTKPKREAFLLANKEYFLPLLPDNNYIDKLQRLHDTDDDKGSVLTAYRTLTDQPASVQATMKPYQLQGLSFLVHMYNNGMSAILGDEMGLGKTLQTLSLFAYLKENEPKVGENRPHLVVCPLSVLSSWVNEAKKWTPNMNVIRFHGPKEERERLKLYVLGRTDRYGNVTGPSKNSKGASGKANASAEPAAVVTEPVDIVVTTYETFTSEQRWFKHAFVWRYCVLDEGHKIKNDKSNVSSALQGLAAEYRLLLTGTPLQNNLHEMWALLHWLYPDVFSANTSDLFSNAFNLTKGKVSTSFMDDARTLLELVMLRRMKSSPGVNLGLPPKEEILLYVPLTPMQRFWYMRLLTKAGGGVMDELFKGAKEKELKALENEGQDDKQIALLEQAEKKLNEARQATDAVDDVWAESKEIMEQAVQNEEVSKDTSDWRRLMNLIIQLRKACSHPYILPGAAPEPYYLGDHIKTASGKFIVLDKLVEELVVKKGKKILIFAGWTTTLNLVEDLLALKGFNGRGAGLRYLRFDGSTGRAKRNLGIRMFNDLTSDYKIMLVSTRAGGLGINLASASDVVFMDEDWNPQVTVQAEARSHRIGQTQKVTVYKLCTQGTVEEQMMGRIRKKLYLSAKITESMRNIHGDDGTSKKRKRGPVSDALDDDAPQLGASQLKSLIRRGAQTLSGPEIDPTEMISWDWETTLDKCKDRHDDAHGQEDAQGGAEEKEQEWLNQMERVESAVFEGKKHQKTIGKAGAETSPDMLRADRRFGKNTTVMIDGYAISKESISCADWEAVPTMGGKDPRLAEPVKVKKEPINHQEHCAVCWDGGSIVLCNGCPRAYHTKCLNADFKVKAKGAMFRCPQHECADCSSKTAEAGGMLYRCRWCERGYCEDCLDWNKARLLGDTLPEFEMLKFGPVDQAYFVECPSCVEHWELDPEDLKLTMLEKTAIEKRYKKFLKAQGRDVEAAKKPLPKGLKLVSSSGRPATTKLATGSGNAVDLTGDDTPEIVSEVTTPLDSEAGVGGPTKKLKLHAPSH
ncbi:hypothetical protein MBLNU230_g1730t1 [Neophaeotheca triangularis]